MWRPPAQPDYTYLFTYLLTCYYYYYYFRLFSGDYFELGGNPNSSSKENLWGLLV